MGQSPNVQVALPAGTLPFPRWRRKFTPSGFRWISRGCDARKFLLNSVKHPFKLRRVNPLKTLPVQVLLDPEELAQIEGSFALVVREDEFRVFDLIFPCTVLFNPSHFFPGERSNDRHFRVRFRTQTRFQSCELQRKLRYLLLARGSR